MFQDYETIHIYFTYDIVMHTVRWEWSIRSPLLKQISKSKGQSDFLSL